MGYIWVRHIDTSDYRFLQSLDTEMFLGGLAHHHSKWSGHVFSVDPFWRIYLPVKGCFELRYADQTVRIEPGSIFLIPPSQPFSFTGVTPSTHYFIHFFSSRMDRIEKFRKVCAVSLESSDECREKFRIILHNLNRMTPDLLKAEESRNALLNLILLFFKDFSSLNEMERKGIFIPVLDYIDSHLNESFPMEKLSEIVGMQRAVFSAEFRRQFGVAPREYLSRRRIILAKELLYRTNLPIKEIAWKCGYENEFFFYRIFRKYAFTTPGEYRNNRLFY